MAYDALTTIGQLFLTTDTSMLPLDIAVSVFLFI